MKKFLIIFYILIGNLILGDNLKKEYIIGVESKMPPFQFVEKGRLQGFDIELLNLIGRRRNIKFHYLLLNEKKSIKKVMDREIDGVLGLRFKKLYETKMWYSDSITDLSTSIISPKKNIDIIQRGFGNRKFLVSLENGSNEYEYIKNMKKIDFNITFDQESIFTLLDLKRADFAIGITEVAEYMLYEKGYDFKYKIVNGYTTPVSYYMGISYGNEALLKIVNEELQKLKINGEYEKLYLKWVKSARFAKEEEMTKTLRRITLGTGILILVLIIIGVWNFQLKKLVRERTRELEIANDELENKIIEIRNTNKLNNLIFESSPRNIMMLNLEGKITIMNENARKLFNLGKNYKEKLGSSHPLLKEILKNGVFESIILDGKVQKISEIEMIEEGKRSIYRYTVYPVSDYMKKIIGGFLTLEDVTEEILLREQNIKREKDTAITTIIAGIAHEIRNPLTSIKTYVELLPLKKDNEKFRQALVEIVPKEVERMNSLIENLIDYAKPKSNSISLIEVDELINSSLLLLNPTLKSSKIKTRCEISKNIFIKGDKGQLKQVILNIILNSIDAINEKRKLGEEKDLYIEIKVYEKDKEVILEIKDDGIGMTEEVKEKIFEVFYTTKPKGSGLGLAITKQIIEKNNGRIKVESKKLEYTKFILTFEVR